jgi:hypothetical protein|tara:strand:+ start:40 stop:282 length:243 start_codon:yes stop_codon:yes gene_type:complete
MVDYVMLNVIHKYDPNQEMHWYEVYDIGDTTDPSVAEVKSSINDPIFHTSHKRRSKAKDALLDWILENKPGVSPHVFKKL